MACLFTGHHSITGEQSLWEQEPHQGNKKKFVGHIINNNNNNNTKNKIQATGSLAVPVLTWCVRKVMRMATLCPNRQRLCLPLHMAVRLTPAVDTVQV